MRTTRLIIKTAVAALALTTAACGGGNDGGSGVASLSGSSSTTEKGRPAGGGTGASGISAEFEDAMVAFAKCMRENGVDFPDPGSGGGLIIGPDSDIDPQSPDFKAAEGKCKPILDEAEKSMPKPSEEELASMRDQMLAFAKCMRDEGIDFPDPKFGEGGHIEAPAGDRDDPDFKAAEETCSKKTGGIGVSRRAPAPSGAR
jgi:hypothetical protein